MKGIIRKTILGIWFFGGLSACTSKPHFTIEGSLDEKSFSGFSPLLEL